MEEYSILPGATGNFTNKRYMPRIQSACFEVQSLNLISEYRRYHIEEEMDRGIGG